MKKSRRAQYEAILDARLRQPDDGRVRDAYWAALHLNLALSKL